MITFAQALAVTPDTFMVGMAVAMMVAAFTVQEGSSVKMVSIGFAVIALGIGLFPLVMAVVFQLAALFR